MRDFFQRYSLVVLVVLVALAPSLVVLSERIEHTNAVEKWLPESSPNIRALENFREHFGREEFVLISWDGCSLDDPRAEFLAARLESLEEIERVHTPERLVQLMTAPPLRLSREEAAQRLEGVLLGRRDPQSGQRTSALAAVLSPQGSKNRPTTVKKIQQTATAAVDLDPEQLYLGGPPAVNAALDIYGKASIDRLEKFLVILCALMCFVALRNWRLAVLVLFTAGYAVLSARALVSLTGGSLNLVMAVMTPLVLVLALSGAVHLANYWRQAAQQGSEHAVARAWQLGWKPCLFASLTTAIGLASLYTSQITPVREFGIYAGAGTLLVLLLVLGALPAGIQLLTTHRRGSLRPPAQGWLRLSSWLSDNKYLVTGVSLGLFVVAAFGLPRLQSQVKVINYFPEESHVFRSYQFLEDHVACLVPIETVVHFENSPLSFSERLQLVREIEQKIRSRPEVRGTLSLATFAPEGPQLALPLAQSLYSRTAEQLLTQRPQSRAFLWSRGDHQMWRITARVPALDDLDYGQLVKELDEPNGPVRTLIRQHGAPVGVDVEFTGLVPVVFEAQQQVLQSLIWSFSLAFGIILIVIALWLRSFWAGVVTMAPNLTPVVLIFGFMGWTGMEIDIASMMTASVALGIAVDGTLHYLTWFQEELKHGQSRRDAIRLAMEHCGPALMQTSLIAGLGLAVLGLSSFEPTSRFGWMMGALLAAALLGDLILLPSLLAGAPGLLVERVVRGTVPERSVAPLTGPHRPGRRLLQHKT